MTCIVGLIDKANKKAYMGCDAAGVDSWYREYIYPGIKVFKKHNNIGEMLIGYTTSFRMGQLLQYKFTLPDDTKADPMEFLCGPFIDEVLKCFKNNNFALLKDNEAIGGVFLITYRGSLYMIQSNFSVMECFNGYGSVGCGDDFAIGALTALSKYNYSMNRLTKDGIFTLNKDKVEIALQTAAQHSAGVSGPFTIIEADL